MDQLKFTNAKLQSDPDLCVLKMIDCLFSMEELVNGNPSGVTKSQDVNRKATVEVLDPEWMKVTWGMFMYAFVL